MTNKNNHGEGISNSIMEFMAFGKPVIASDCGGNSELIINEYNGFIIKRNSSKLLIDKILFLRDNNKILKTIGNNAYLTIKNKFNIENMLNSFVKVYKEIK